LLQEHHDDMLKHSPQESVHALDISLLKSADVTFFSVWDNDKLAGCGALKELTTDHAELKSMRTSKCYLRKGVAAKLLTHILKIAESRHYSKVSLETGTANAFVPAQKLYKSFAFETCEPFSNYAKDPYSVYFTKSLGQ